MVHVHATYVVIDEYYKYLYSQRTNSRKLVLIDTRTAHLFL